MPVLELLDIHKSYRSHLSIRKYWILRGLSLSIREGEIFGAIGTNGAGKTTLIKLALGLIFPDAGVVRLFGEETSRVAPRRISPRRSEYFVSLATPMTSYVRAG